MNKMEVFATFKDLIERVAYSHFLYIGLQVMKEEQIYVGLYIGLIRMAFKLRTRTDVQKNIRALKNKGRLLCVHF